MRRASEIITNIINSEKEEKYQKMMKHQEKIVEEAIHKGDVHGSRLFVFSDKGYFHGIQEPWYEEFYERAKREVECAGYKVKGICIYW